MLNICFIQRLAIGWIWTACHDILWLKKLLNQNIYDAGQVAWPHFQIKSCILDSISGVGGWKTSCVKCIRKQTVDGKNLHDSFSCIFTPFKKTWQLLGPTNIVILFSLRKLIFQVTISLYVCFFNNCPFPSMLVYLTLIILKLLNIFFPIFVNMCSLFLCLYLSNLYKCPSFSFSLSRLYLSLYLSARLPVYTAKETFYQPKSIS